MVAEIISITWKLPKQIVLDILDEFTTESPITTLWGKFSFLVVNF